MHRRAARGNKIGLTLTGLILAVAGAALFLAHQGRIASAGADSALYPPSTRRFVHENASWLWPVTAAVAILIGLTFLRWLLLQPRTDRLSRLVIDTDQYSDTDQYANTDQYADTDLPRHTDPHRHTNPARHTNSARGRTRMPAHAITDIVEDDIAALPGVRRVSAALSGHADSPQLWLRVSTESNADVARIRSAITGHIVGDARACLDLPRLPIYLRLTVTRRDGRRTARSATPRGNPAPR